MTDMKKIPQIVQVFGKGWGSLALGAICFLWPWVTFWVNHEIDLSNGAAAGVFIFFEALGLIIIVASLLKLTKYKNP